MFRIAFVTGAGGAVGRAVILGLVKYGVKRVAGLDIDDTSLEGTKSAVAKSYPGAEFFPIRADLSSEDAIAGAIAEVVAKFGRIDYAINNAGIGQPLLPSADLASKDFDKTMGINFRGLWLCEKYELQQMKSQEARSVHASNESLKERGAIVNVASTLGLLAMPHLSAYSSSKHAIVGLTKCDALDYAKEGIRVNAVAPGFIDTPLLLEDTRNALKPIIERVPQSRLASSEEVADAICFLCSGLASHITGITLPVDGGLTAT
jgi:NAD(P)-dependent dehydrogenase (short-subunit alcohol dehydrogenase family)